MRSRLLPCLLLTLGSTAAGTAQEYSVATLADSLRQNAQAVVRLYETDFQYNSPSSATARHDIVVTLLDRRGARHADLVCYVDMFSSLKSFSAEICDASGRVIRKLGKGDLNYTEYSQHLADDAAYYWLEPPLSVFPCTVRYRYETAHKNGMFGTLRFVPLSTDIGVALEKARFRLSTPAGYAFNCRCTPFPVEPVRHTDRGRDNYEWTFPSRTAVLDEPLIPPARERLPILYFAPSEFTYDKTQGNMQDWPRFGVWMDGLLAGRGQLPLALQTEVHALTDTIPDKREKIEALYHYLGRTTRYVSIQLGIGGWQPMDAATVYANKFGDCKALSNYLHAMLAACDIESFYTIIHTQNKHIPRDFATPAIANHAILGVPCQRDTLWLECTNTDVPFGYVHQSIAGHDAVICHDGKAEVVTLPAYADSLNTECQRIDVRLDEAGNASLSLSSVSRARQYEWTRPILDLARDKQADFLRRSFQLPLAQVDSLRCEEVLDMPLPEMHIRASITALRYANKTGSRLFVPVAPLRSGPGRFTAERRHDLWIDKGYCDTDSLTLHLPEGYVVEALPKSVTIENRFGKVAFEALFGPLPAKRVCSLPRIHAGRRPRLFGQNRPAQGINDRSATPERVVADRLKGAAETSRRIPKPTISGCSDDAPRRGRSSWRNSLRRPGSDRPPSGWPDKPAPTGCRPFRRRDSPSRRP